MIPIMIPMMICNHGTNLCYNIIAMTLHPHVTTSKFTTPPSKIINDDSRGGWSIPSRYDIHLDFARRPLIASQKIVRYCCNIQIVY